MLFQYDLERRCDRQRTMYIFYLGTIRVSRTTWYALSFLPWMSIVNIRRWLDTTPASRVITRCAQDIRASGFHCPSNVSVISPSTSQSMGRSPRARVAPISDPDSDEGFLSWCYGRDHTGVSFTGHDRRCLWCLSWGNSCTVEGYHLMLLVLLASVRAYGADKVVIRESLARINKHTRTARMICDLHR